MVSALLLTACLGETLDVGDATDASSSSSSVADADADAGPDRGDISAIEGVWVMTRQDGPPSVQDPGPVPAMELEIAEDGMVHRSLCGRAADEQVTAACPAQATFDCRAGTARADGNGFRLDIPSIHVGGVPEQGQVVMLTDGTILVRYINPTYSIGYFRRIGTKDAVGHCPR